MTKTPLNKARVQLSAEDKAQIRNEAESRGAAVKSEARIALEARATDYDDSWDVSEMSDAELEAQLAILDLAAMEEDDFEAGMAEELAKRQAHQAKEEAARIAAENAAEANHPMTRSHPLAGQQALVRHNVDLPKSGNEIGNCPHCGKSTRKGRNVTEFSEMSPGSQNSTDQQFTCNDCAGEWGPVVDKPKKARAPSGSSNGLKIEQNRETRNGVTRPSAGGKCRGVWDMLDSIGVNATAKQAREAAEGRFDKTTTMVQFYRWRKFNGIEGRQ